jgi:antitoxin component YwqK of YwqJK toxin-antitoxin module/Tfp pilus assembly protein PilF
MNQLNKTFSLVFVFHAFILTILHSQVIPDSLVLGSDWIRQGMELHDTGDYDKALEAYNRVSDCDASYPWAVYEKALTYQEMGELLKALELCYKVEQLNYQEPSLYILMGSLLDNLGQAGEGIKVFRSALSRWPYNQSLHYNLGVTLANTGDLLAAEMALQQSILVDPYHAKSHLALADVNHKMGRPAQSFLAFSFATMLNPQIRLIQKLQDQLTGHLDHLSRPNDFPYSENYEHAHWDRLKHLVQSELAFHDDFPYDFEVSYSITRQTYMLFSSLSSQPADTSLYNQLYQRFYYDLMNTYGFEVYLNYMLKDTNDEKVKKWRDENEELTNQFIEWAQNTINTRRAYNFSTELETRKQKVYHYSDGDLGSIGILNENVEPSKEGKWIYLNDQGHITDQGSFTANKREGEWFIYWEDGSVKQHLKYTDDDFDGLCITYHKNGEVSGEYPMAKGERNGEQKLYSLNGDLIEKSTFSQNQLEGEYYFLNIQEGFEQEINYSGDKLEGDFNETWINGQPRLGSAYKNDQAQGIHTTYYKNGTPKSLLHYRNDQKVDSMMDYHPNGMVSRTAFLNDSSRLDGDVVFYDRNGHKIAEEVKYQDGKLNGVRREFFLSGEIASEDIYKEDVIMGQKYFDRDGHLIYDVLQEDTTFYYKRFFADGILKEEGLIINGKRNGLWKSYNPIGSLLEEREYLNNMSHGKVRSYYSNGQIQMTYECDSNYIEGVFVEYSKQGNILRIGGFKKGEWHGIWKSYFENGVVMKESFYDDGIQQGKLKYYDAKANLVSEEYFDEEGHSIRIVYYNHKGEVSVDFDLSKGDGKLVEKYPNGQSKREFHFSNYLRHGKQLRYYPNGQVETEEAFKYGFEDGPSKGWDYNGDERYIYPYILGQADGQIRFYKKGQVSSERAYELGSLQGIRKTYHENGQLHTKREMLDDEYHGISDYYDPQGAFMFRMHYFNGYMKSISYKKANGEFSKEQLITDDEQTVVCYFENGKISGEFNIKAGNYLGQVRWYHSNGKKFRECDYNNGSRHGKESYFYPSGKQKELFNWQDGEEEGDYRSYHSNGKVEWEGQYLCGQRVGIWNHYSSAGQLIEKLHYQNDEVYEIEVL